MGKKAWQLVFAPFSGAVYLFPEEKTFSVGERVELGEEGSWRVRSIETEPSDALPRLILDPSRWPDDVPE